MYVQMCRQPVRGVLCALRSLSPSLWSGNSQMAWIHDDDGNGLSPHQSHVPRTLASSGRLAGGYWTRPVPSLYLFTSHTSCPVTSTCPSLQPPSHRSAMPQKRAAVSGRPEPLPMALRDPRRWRPRWRPGFFFFSQGAVRTTSALLRRYSHIRVIYIHARPTGPPFRPAGRARAHQPARQSAPAPTISGISRPARLVRTCHGSHQC